MTSDAMYAPMYAHKSFIVKLIQTHCLYDIKYINVDVMGLEISTVITTFLNDFGKMPYTSGVIEKYSPSGCIAGILSGCGDLCECDYTNFTEIETELNTFLIEQLIENGSKQGIDTTSNEERQIMCKMLSEQFVIEGKGINIKATAYKYDNGTTKDTRNIRAVTPFEQKILDEYLLPSWSDYETFIIDGHLRKIKELGYIIKNGSDEVIAIEEYIENEDGIYSDDYIEENHGERRDLNNGEIITAKKLGFYVKAKNKYTPNDKMKVPSIPQY